MPEMRGHLRAWAGTLLALSACAGDSPGSGRSRGEHAMGEEHPPAAMAGAPAQGPAAPNDPAAMSPAPTAPATTPGGAPAGTFKPRATLDPNAKFDWPESSPGGGSECQAGTYTGTFMCTFMDPSGWIPPIELTGPVSLTFSKSMDGEFLEISNGLFEAVANLFIGARANIQGKLDCNTLTLQASAVDGTWALGDPNAPIAPGGALSGDITGTLDPATGTLAGDWTFGDPAIGNCPGKWSVTYAP
jgi:hypothetical protein